tara:strand:+ start:180 stop:3143 length:2964 start_codon:yes stop_codon:yes gene_type:complete
MLVLFTQIWGQDVRATIQSGPINYLDTLPERPLCALPELTQDFERKHLEKMERNYPGVYAKMRVPPVLKKSAEVGSIQKFWVIVDDDDGGTKSEEVVAEMLAKGEHTAIWADTSKLATANNISASLAEQYVKLLEQSTPSGSVDSTKGVYDIELEYFGSPPDYDGDGIVDFLFADIYTGAGGYFRPMDQTNYTGSNRRDILYIDIFAGVSYTEGTLSHELQHLIHYNYDQNESTQFNEGLSEVATIICGGNYISHAHYLNQADEIGWTWESSAAHYSMASLFSIYYVEQLGLSAIKDFVQMTVGGYPKQSWQAFDQLLSKYGQNMGHKGWLMNWFTANYLNNKIFDPKYGYTLWMPMSARVSAKHLTGQIESSGNMVKDFGVNYIEYLSSTDSMEITFAASDGVPNYRSLEYNDTTIVVNSLSNGIKHILNHNNLKVKSATFIVASTNSQSFSYDYVSDGTDASGWTGFEVLAYDDDDPDLFTTSDGSQFGYLGWGNNTAGRGWGVSFDPKMTVNQLVELNVMVGFAQEFSGSTTSPNADKDFYIYFFTVTDPSTGEVQSIMDPILWSTSRTGITGDFSTIDLTPYKDQLSNLGPLVITVVDDDTIGTYFAMDKNAKGKNYTFAYNYNNSGVLDSMKNFSVGGESLNGWNYMFRASFYVADNTIPNIQAGYMQHPTFTDVMKVYIVGNSILSPDHMTITANNAGYESVLDVQAVASNDSLLLVEQFKLNTSGALDISVKGTLRYGRTSIDTTFKYNVNYTLSKVGGDVASRDGIYTISIPENSLSEDSYVIVGKDPSGPGTVTMYNDLVMGTIYTAGPIGKTLATGATISLALNGMDAEALSIGYWDGEVWRELRSSMSADGTSLEGIGTHLGHYALIAKGSGMPLAVDEKLMIPTEYALAQNYPNPFNPETRIHYELPESGHVRLVIYDILGRELVQLVNTQQGPGRYHILWKGEDASGLPVSSGIYFYQLKSGSFSETKKMVVSR